MNRSLLLHFGSVAAAGLMLLTSAPAARAENPLERLHRHLMSALFGQDEDHDKDRKKSKHHDEYRRPPNFEFRISTGRFEDDRSEVKGHAEGRFDDADTEERAATDEQAPSLEAEVQSALRVEGYYRGSIDGDLNDETRAAIRDYQLDQHLKPTGHIDLALVKALRL